MATQRKESFWESYRRDLRNSENTLYGGRLQEFGQIMDIIQASRAIGLAGLAAIGTGAIVEIATKKSPLREVGKFTGRTVAGAGVAALGGAIAGELFGRKAYQVYNEVRLEEAQKREVSLKEQTEKYRMSGV